MSRNFYASRKTIRHPNWSYSWKGSYFVTINTKFGEHYFGKIVSGKMQLNEIGTEVKNQWIATPTLRPDMNIRLDEFIIMPNHFHGIIGIGRNEFNLFPKIVPGSELLSYGETCDESELPKGIFGPQRKNLGSIVRGFKSSVTSWCLKNQQLFDWHSRYYDVIIRDEVMLHKIRNYIRNNPLKWERDRFNKSSS